MPSSHCPHCLPCGHDCDSWRRVLEKPDQLTSLRGGGVVASRRPWFSAQSEPSVYPYVVASFSYSSCFTLRLKTGPTFSVNTSSPSHCFRHLTSAGPRRPGSKGFLSTRSSNKISVPPFAAPQPSVTDRADLSPLITYGPRDNGSSEPPIFERRQAVCAAHRNMVAHVCLCLFVIETWRVMLITGPQKAARSAHNSPL